MTLEELFRLLGNHPQLLLGYFIGIPIGAFLIVLLAGDNVRQNPWTVMFSVLVYLVTIPGTFALTLCGYSAFFERTNLLEVNTLIYFLPILSMLTTYYLISRKIPLKLLPGFRKISGLLMILALTFIVMLIFQKTRFWIMFVGGFSHIIVLFIIIFILFSLGWSRLTGDTKNN